MKFESKRVNFEMLIAQRDKEVWTTFVHKLKLLI